MITPLLPGSTHHCSESIFRRLEPDIKRIVEAFPRTITFKVLTYKPESYRTTFRTVCRALIHPRCTWVTSIDKEAVRSMWANGFAMRIDPYNNTITCGPKEVFAERVPTLESLGRIDVQQNVEIMQALVTLKHHEVITSEVRMTNVNLSVVQALEERYPHLLFDLNETDLSVI